MLQGRIVKVSLAFHVEFDCSFRQIRTDKLYSTECYGGSAFDQMEEDTSSSHYRRRQHVGTWQNQDSEPWLQSCAWGRPEWRVYLEAHLPRAARQEWH